MKRKTEERQEEAKKQRVEEDKNVPEFAKSELEEQTPVVVEEIIDDFSDPLLIEYKEKLRESKGFYAIALPRHLEVQTHAYAELNDEILQQLSEAALKSFNQANEGSDFVFHSVIMGNWSNISGKLYRVTFRARPSKSNHTNDDIKEFQAAVRYCPLEKKRHLSVGDCTVKTKLEYPIHFEHKDLLQFSEEAVEFFNQKHQGSHFLLHSVVNGNYTPIVGYPFRVTFRTRASNEKDIKEYEATLRLNFPCGQSKRATVIECTHNENAEYPVNSESESKGNEEAERSKEKTRKFVAYKKWVQTEDCSALLAEEYKKLIKKLNPLFGMSCHLNHIMNVELESQVLQEMSKVAIKFYNKANGSDFVFHSVVMGNFILYPRRIYDVTFRARPSKSNDDENIKEFEAITQYFIRPKKSIPVHNCIIKPEREYALDLKHADLLARDYVLDFTSKALVEYSKEALQYFNQEHEGSDYVLHSVVKVSQTSIFGRPFTVTFRAKASNEEDLKEFEGKLKHNLPGKKVEDGKFRRVTVVGCDIKNREEEKKRAEFEKAKAKEIAEQRKKDYNDPLLKEYNKRMIDSKGFHAMPLPHHLDILDEVYQEYDEKYLLKVSEAAIKFYNEANGSDFVFHSVVMGNFHPCAWRYYRVTFRARPSESNHTNDDDIKEFQVRALYRPWEDNPVQIDDCTLKPEREYPLDFEHEQLVEFSEEAVKFFNENHEGSHFVFHSVLKCSNYTPIGGSNVRLTFKASNDGDEDYIQEFEAKLGLKLPWVQYSAIAAVFECALKSESESKGKQEAVGVD